MNQAKFYTLDLASDSTHYCCLFQCFSQLACVKNASCHLQARQKQLESLGISLQSSGIRVVNDKCFLVNLNADPALNEMLVYYLKVAHIHSWVTHTLTHLCIHSCHSCVTCSLQCPGTHSCWFGKVTGHPAVWYGHPS